MQIPTPLFSPAQWGQLDALLGTFNTQQRLWLSGYLAGTSQTAADSPAAPADTGQKVLIAFGTETNNCRQLATNLAEQCASAGIAAEVADLASLRLRRLGKLEYLVVITATHGDGDPPEPILPFYEAIMAEDAAQLAGLKFAVLALGDSSYEHFCVTGIELDQRLEALGAVRLIPRQDCDVDFARPAAEWMEQLLPKLPRTQAAAAPVATATSADQGSLYSKENPLEVEVLANQNLSHASRQQPIHHLELALDADNFPVLPGDAVGILAENPPALVAMLLDATGLSGEQPVTLGHTGRSPASPLRPVHSRQGLSGALG